MKGVPRREKQPDDIPFGSNVFANDATQTRCVDHDTSARIFPISIHSSVGSYFVFQHIPMQRAPKASWASRDRYDQKGNSADDGSTRGGSGRRRIECVHDGHLELPAEMDFSEDVFHAPLSPWLSLETLLVDSAARRREGFNQKALDVSHDERCGKNPESERLRFRSRSEYTATRGQRCTFLSLDSTRFLPDIFPEYSFPMQLSLP